MPFQVWRGAVQNIEPVYVKRSRSYRVGVCNPVLFQAPHLTIWADWSVQWLPKFNTPGLPGQLNQKHEVLVTLQDQGCLTVLKGDALSLLYLYCVITGSLLYGCSDKNKNTPPNPRHNRPSSLSITSSWPISMGRESPPPLARLQCWLPGIRA